jgi:hypothetical protein
MEGQCDSGGEWFDSDGPYYSCSNFYYNSWACCAYGSDYPNGGLTANDACCTCADAVCDDFTTWSWGSWSYDTTLTVFNMALTLEITGVTVADVTANLPGLDVELLSLLAGLAEFEVNSVTSSLDGDRTIVVVDLYFLTEQDAQDFTSFIAGYQNFNWMNAGVSFDAGDIESVNVEVSTGGAFFPELGPASLATVSSAAVLVTLAQVL